jgi:hypothetical protein
MTFRSSFKAYQYGQSIVGLETQGQRAIQTLSGLQNQLASLKTQIQEDEALTTEDKTAGVQEVNDIQTELTTANHAHPPPSAHPRRPFGHAMSLFHYATNLIIELEGGDKLHTHPNDPGGTTKYGISQAAHPHVDVPTLTRGAAKAIYREHYWNPVTSRVVEPAMQILVYDSAIQHGTQTALEWYATHKTFDAYMAHRVAQQACRHHGRRRRSPPGQPHDPPHD